MSACAMCQGGQLTRWSNYTASCPKDKVVMAWYGHTVPQNTTFPSWAYLPVNASTDTWDPDAAQSLLPNEAMQQVTPTLSPSSQSTETQPSDLGPTASDSNSPSQSITTSSTPAPTTSSTPTPVEASTTNHKKPVASLPIAIAAIISFSCLSIGIYALHYIHIRRRRKNSKSLRLRTTSDSAGGGNGGSNSDVESRTSSTSAESLEEKFGVKPPTPHSAKFLLPESPSEVFDPFKSDSSVRISTYRGPQDQDRLSVCGVEVRASAGSANASMESLKH
ncbi:hypothetical protein K474DRAFT_1407840 [Panus rudis PR-1116 ss-1]|nr:hypothetical protein K474DRAFT_1407840 [Panus rudis PR-1116 ss-1]